MRNDIAANVLGTFGAVCWSVQLIPQIILNYRRHHAEGLQPTMMMLWACAGIPLGVYNIVSAFNIALRIQAQILTGLSLITWIQCQYYEKKWPIPKCLAVVLPIACFIAGVETSLVYALRIGAQRGVHWPLTLMPVLAALLLALGVLRHYLDIYQYRTIRGISFLFVALDALGDLTSLLSLLFQENLDVLGLVVYGVELALWIGVFAAGGYYKLLPWLKRKMSAFVSSSEEPGRLEIEPNNTVYLHDVSSSSTSVFQTISGHAHGHARARGIARADNGSLSQDLE